MVEQWTENSRVSGSIPLLDTYNINFNNLLIVKLSQLLAIKTDFSCK